MRAGGAPRRRRFQLSEAGSVLPLFGLVAAILTVAAAFAADYGSAVVAKRRLQGAADLAALVAAQAPGQDSLARASLADNGFPTPSGLRIEAGRYDGDPTIAPALRFQPGGALPNAVRVSLESSAPLFLGRAAFGQDRLALAAQATAAQARFASLSIGSRLVALQGGVVNAVLGSMFGAQLGLTAMDYAALADAKLDAFSLLDALAGSTDLRVATYREAAAGQVTLGRLGAALPGAAQSAGATYPSVTALGLVATALRGLSAPVGLTRILDIGEIGGGLAGTAAIGGRSATLRAFDVLSGMAGLANGTRQVQLDLGASLPGIAQARLTLAIGERPQSLAVASPVGSTVRTAQTRLLLESWLALPLGLGRLYLPIYIEAAGAQASLQAISCPWSVPDQLAVAVSAAPSAFDAAIAAVAPAAVTAAGARPDLSVPALLLQAPLVAVSGRSRVTVAAPAPQTLVFSRQDIEAARARTVATTGIATSLVASLAGNLVLEAEVAGLGLSVSGVRSTVLAAILAAAPTLDLALDSALAGAGIGIGQAEIRVPGIRCDRAVLVQ